MTKAERDEASSSVTLKTMQSMTEAMDCKFMYAVVLACDAMGISRCTYYYQPKLVDDNEIIEAVSELAQKHTTYGFKKIHKRLRLMVDYNYERPHESLNDLPPKEYERLDQENSLEV